MDNKNCNLYALGDQETKQQIWGKTMFLAKISSYKYPIQIIDLSKLTDGNAHSQSCSHETTRWSSTDFRGSINQLGDPLEDAAQSSQVVNTPEPTACKRDVPLLVPVKHLLPSFHPLKTTSLILLSFQSSIRVQPVHLDFPSVFHYHINHCLISTAFRG